MRLINRKPGPMGAVALAALPFVLIVLLYASASAARLAENPNDKLLPAFSTLGESIQRLATQPNVRTGEILLWGDTWASLQRLGLGLGLSALLGLLMGLANGMLPYMRASMSPLVRVVSMIPPMAVLPILFIVFGLGELAKVMLILFGVAPFVMRDIEQRVRELPAELLIKAQTLGGNSWQIMLRVVLPQVLPRLFESVRLMLGTAWLFLIAAEAIAATDGLGYRIFLVRRYMALDVILPYVAWITLLAFTLDWLLRASAAKLFPWFYQQEGR